VPDLLTTIQADIRAKLDELRPVVDEATRLEAALAHLDGTAVPTGKSSLATARGGKPRRRQTEVLELLARRPDQRSSEIASALGIASSQASALLRRLADAGIVAKTGYLYRLS
jgi:DNA-binding MarR family transcriptional regulator